MNNLNKDLQPRKLTLLLIVCYLLISIPINWILQYFLGTPWPDWMLILLDLIDYIIISLLIWVERFHLEDYHIDFWSICLFLLFGSLLRPIYTHNPVVAFLSNISFIFIGVLLFLGLRKKHIRLSKSSRPFIWLLVGSIFCLLEIFMITRVFMPLIGISVPASIPIVNYFSMFMFYLCNVAISEEALFRGFLWGTLYKFGYSLKKIFIIQAVLFTAAHIRFYQPEPIVAYLGIFGLSLLYGFLAWKSKSIFPSIITHAIHDTIIYFVK
jgi:membrane protease YdiL (CAAX protease family)